MADDKDDSDDKVVNLGLDRTFPQETELNNRLVELCDDYHELGPTACMGALLAAAMDIYTANFLSWEEVDEDE